MKSHKDDLVFIVKIWPPQPILGIRILAGLEGKDFDVCVGAHPWYIGQCETFSGSNMQEVYYLSQMVHGMYVKIRVHDFGGNLNVCELEILAADDCPTPAPTTPPVTPDPCSAAVSPKKIVGNPCPGADYHKILDGSTDT